MSKTSRTKKKNEKGLCSVYLTDLVAVLNEVVSRSLYEKTDLSVQISDSRQPCTLDERRIGMCNIGTNRLHLCCGVKTKK